LFWGPFIPNPDPPYYHPTKLPYYPTYSTNLPLSLYLEPNQLTTNPLATFFVFSWQNLYLFLVRILFLGKTYTFFWLNFFSWKKLYFFLAKILSFDKTCIFFWLKFSLFAEPLFLANFFSIEKNYIFFWLIFFSFGKNFIFSWLNGFFGKTYIYSWFKFSFSAKPVYFLSFVNFYLLI
jgi:hypothetical protein